MDKHDLQLYSRIWVFDTITLFREGKAMGKKVGWPVCLQRRKNEVRRRLRLTLQALLRRRRWYDPKAKAIALMPLVRKAVILRR